jgi:hypothetical protein
MFLIWSPCVPVLQERRSVGCNRRLAEIIGVCHETLLASLVAQEVNRVSDLNPLDLYFLQVPLSFHTFLQTHAQLGKSHSNAAYAKLLVVTNLKIRLTKPTPCCPLVNGYQAYD